MSPEVRDRVFEPLFTTKEMGRVTGPGLAMVYGFVKQSGGHVTIEASPQLKGSVNPHARETILVVEDDERVRRLTITRLQLIGYQVLEASDGRRQ